MPPAQCVCLYLLANVRAQINKQSTNNQKEVFLNQYSLLPSLSVIIFVHLLIASVGLEKWPTKDFELQQPRSSRPIIPSHYSFKKKKKFCRSEPAHLANRRGMRAFQNTSWFFFRRSNGMHSTGSAIWLFISLSATLVRANLVFRNILWLCFFFGSKILLAQNNLGWHIDSSFCLLIL